MKVTINLKLKILFFTILSTGCSEGFKITPGMATGTLVCPDGYVRVGANSSLQTSQFCIMKYEAKAWDDTNSDGVIQNGEIEAKGCPGTCDNATIDWASIYHPISNPSGIRPVSVPEGMPWRRIKQSDGKAACQSIGNGYDLISNNEWLAVAYEAEVEPENWSSGQLGVGHFNRGFSAASAFDGFGNNEPAPATSTACIFNTAIDTCNSAGPHQFKRTHKIASAEEVWDLAGNTWEWIDWTLGGALDYPSLCNILDQGDFDYIQGSCPQLSNEDIFPKNPLNLAVYNSTINLGWIFGSATGGPSARGGAWYSGEKAGIFSLTIDYTPTTSLGRIGFRCVYRGP